MLFSLIFHSQEAVSHSRDPQLNATENYSDPSNWRSPFSNLRVMRHISLSNNAFLRDGENVVVQMVYKCFVFAGFLSNLE